MPEAPEPTERQIPPYNGFGNEVDTLGYIYDLIPKKPKGDFFKSVDNDKKILRYTARFNTRVPEDIDRRFIISFYLADDSISIYEPAVKNSGIIEGPFLRRNKYKNVDKNNLWITPTDLPIGGNIKINGYSYSILSCDEYTVKYLQQHLDWTAECTWTCTSPIIKWFKVLYPNQVSRYILFNFKFNFIIIYFLQSDTCLKFHS